MSNDAGYFSDDQPTPQSSGVTCPSCGADTRKDDNGFDICTFSNVPKEDCFNTYDDRAAKNG